MLITCQHKTLLLGEVQSANITAVAVVIDLPIQFDHSVVPFYRYNGRARKSGLVTPLAFGKSFTCCPAVFLSTSVAIVDSGTSFLLPTGQHKPTLHAPLFRFFKIFKFCK